MGKSSIKDRLFNLGGTFPAPLKRVVKYSYYTATLGRKEKDWLILNTIPKSGTMYFMMFMANYFRLVYEDADDRTSYHEMQNVLFPNERARYIRTGRLEPPHPIMANSPFSDFLFCHQTTFLEYFNGKLVFLYRNPLDLIISSYFYFWRLQPKKAEIYSHPREVADRYLTDFIAKYSFMRAWAKRKPNFLCLSYETMKRAPFEMFTMVVLRLGLPLDIPKLRRAVEFSSFDASRKEELENGPIHPPTKDYQGFFTRSGEIGQWKEFFDDADLKRIWSRLEAAGIQRSEFILE